MGSKQLPPPLANFTFPPANTELHFNYVDSFVTSWVTPTESTAPCFFSLYYWNSSTPNAPWTCKLNQTVPLNGTTTLPLKGIDSEGLGQLNLNYVDPESSHQKITGSIFHINHDPTQPKAMTWNQNALSSSTSPSPVPATSSPSASTPTVSSSPSITISPSPASGTQHPNPAKDTSNPNGATVANITLGIILLVVITALCLISCVQYQRRRKRRKARPKPKSRRTPPATAVAEQPYGSRGQEAASEPRVPPPPATAVTTVPPSKTAHGIHEIDAAEASVRELGSGDGDERWELAAVER